MFMMINGIETNQISALDRGLQYGDGCFTTSHVINQNVLYFDFHIARLHDDSERLHFPHVDWIHLSELIAKEAFSMMRLAAQTDLAHDAVLKIILTRSIGERGYSPVDCDHITRILSLTPYPKQYVALQKTGVHMGISHIRLANNPLLAGIKHLNRLEQILIKRELSQTPFDDAIVLDQYGKIIEASASNIFWRKKDKIYTPDVSKAGINGLMRQRVIDLLNRTGFCHVEVVRETVDTLQNADEIFLSNALMPIIPVKKITLTDNQVWEYSPLKRQAWPYLFPQLIAGK